ncbi:MAG: hypothetical protein K0V04_45035 [Deltaproteobacteria bacterium]|nr:hypothetical protein [Deltaproteobacteria bacterium]
MAPEATPAPSASVTADEAAPSETSPVEAAPVEVVPVEPAPAETPTPAPVVSPEREASIGDAVAEETLAPVVDGDSEADETPTAEPTVDRKAGDHLRPPGEDELRGKHPVDPESGTYKPGTGLTLTSKDGRFELATRLRAQFRYTFEHDGESDDLSHGLQIRRARLQFKGHVFNEHNRFKTELAVSPRDMGFDGDVTHRTPILDWYFDFTYLRDLTVRIGQYKVPFSRQRVVSSGDLQLVDRSLANGEFNLDRDIGLDLRSKDFLGLGKLRYYAGIYFGEGRDQYRPSNFDMFYLARVEFLPFGMFKDYKEADFARSLRPRLSLGAAYAFVDGAVGNRGVRGSTPSDGGTTDYHNATADVMFKVAGFSLFADVFYRQGRRNFGDAVVEQDDGTQAPAEQEASRNGLGWSATVGYLIPRVPFEIAGRYSQALATGNSSSLSRRDEAGGGISYYFAGHPLKLQLDYFTRFPEGQLREAGNEVRLQLQAAF